MIWTWNKWSPKWDDESQRHTTENLFATRIETFLVISVKIFDFEQKHGSAAVIVVDTRQLIPELNSEENTWFWIERKNLYKQNHRVTAPGLLNFPLAVPAVLQNTIFSFYSCSH